MSITEQIRIALRNDARKLVDISMSAKIHKVQLCKFRAGKLGIGPDAMERLAKVLGLSIIVGKNKGKRVVA